MNTLERIEEAIEESRFPGSAAKSVLRILRYPSRTMVLEGRKLRVHPQYTHSETYDVFRGMIDTALRGDTALNLSAPVEPPEADLIHQLDNCKGLLIELMSRPGIDKLMTDKLTRNVADALEEPTPREEPTDGA